MGPYGPELLTYDLVRTRAARFPLRHAAGASAWWCRASPSGPVWDKVCKLLISLDGAEHHRLRRLVSRAFTPRAAERMRGACVDVITELVDRHSPAGRCDMVTDIARPYPVPIICALLGAPREDWHLFSSWADDISKAFGANVAEEAPAIVRAWEQLEAYVEDLIAAPAAIPDRRPDLRAHPSTGSAGCRMQFGIGACVPCTFLLTRSRLWWRRIDFNAKSLGSICS